ncbi:MAG: M20/M25/M40 family metallo-hydrolase [Spirochaetaceae bacterium]|nr:MAG: M20/M25/M40 family metallo-hydrolase [Spirochaetaceae bacterium]
MTPQTMVHEQIVPLLQKLIQNACVNTGDDDSGQETRSIETIREFLRERDIDSRLYYQNPDRANLVARIRGENPMAPTIAYMGHVDVVPADVADWSRDPFSGEVHNGEVWGRGAVDMLGMVAAFTAAFASFAESGRRPPGDVLLVIVSDEEAGGTFGARYLIENHWDEVKCDYMITEVGGLHIHTDSGPAITMTVGEKGVCWVRMKFRGVPGHGSMPYRSSNAAMLASEALVRIGRATTRRVMTPLVREMSRAFFQGHVEHLLSRLPGCFDRALARLYRRDPGKARFLDTASRMTISPGVVRGGSKVNIVPDRAEIEFDVRILPGQTVEQTQEALRGALGTLSDEAEIEFFEFFPANTSEQDTPLWRATEQICSEILPGTRIVPMYMGGVTDGRYWRQRGTTVYGFAANSPALTMDRFSRRIHGIDERIDLQSLELNTGYLMRLPYEIGRF